MKENKFQISDGSLQMVDFKTTIRNPNPIFQILISALLILFFTNATAQCAMCRASLESEGNLQKAEAVNDGIVYLMAVPYILAGILGFVIYRMYNKRNKIK